MASCEALIQKLHSGSPSEQLEAVIALTALPLTPRNWLSAVGAVPRLVQLLSTSTSAPRTRALSHLLERIPYPCLEGRNVEAAPAGIIPPLVTLLLRHDDAFVQHVAAMTLSSLASAAGNHDLIMDAGAIAPLAQLLKSDQECLHLPAARNFASLAENSIARTRIIAAGAIYPLLQLLDSITPVVRLSAAIAVRKLCCNNAGPVSAAGGIPVLVQLLRSSSSSSSSSSVDVDVQVEAVQALGNLACEVNFIVQLVAAGAVPLLVGLLRPSGASGGILPWCLLLLLLVKAAAP